MTELAVPFVAGLFGLIPLMWQLSATRAQRQDRMTRLTHLRAELELLERLNTLRGLVQCRRRGRKARNESYDREPSKQAFGPVQHAVRDRSLYCRCG
jgi:hypothetical protein